MGSAGKFPFRILVAGIVLLAAPCAYGQHVEVTGKVRVAGRTAGQMVPTIVYAEPLSAPAPKRPVKAALEQRDKTFVPHVLALPAGSKVDFPNRDVIYHNIFSLSQPDPFDLGLYGGKASKSRTFSKPATLRVFCNIHPQMTAVILILPTPYITEADASGAFKLALPPGRYRLTAWSERSSPASVEIEVSAGGGTVPELQMDESGHVELPHKNKYGVDYPRLPATPRKAP